MNFKLNQLSVSSKQFEIKFRNYGRFYITPVLIYLAREKRLIRLKTHRGRYKMINLKF